MLKIFRNWLNQHFSDPQVVILGFLLFLGFLLIFMLGDLLTPVIASLVIAYLLEGMVAGLQRLKIPHIISVRVPFG